MNSRSLKRAGRSMGVSELKFQTPRKSGCPYSVRGATYFFLLVSAPTAELMIATVTTTLINVRISISLTVDGECQQQIACARAARIAGMDEHHSASDRRTAHVQTASGRL